MKTDRFSKRREMLRRRHKCTRCGTGTPKPDCRLCPDCLAILSAKRLIRDDVDAERRRKEDAQRRAALLHAAAVQLEKRFSETL